MFNKENEDIYINIILAILNKVPVEYYDTEQQNWLLVNNKQVDLSGEVDYRIAKGEGLFCSEFWKYIEPQWKYAFKDISGNIFVSTQKPTLTENGWELTCCDTWYSIDPTVLDILCLDASHIYWKLSMTERPEE